MQPNNPSSFVRLPLALLPVIYEIKRDEKSKEYFLVPILDKFELPKKIYGTSEKIAARVWNHYVKSGKSSGIMLTGKSGTGKTDVGKIISNIALSYKIPVVRIINIQFTIELIAFLNSLSDVVLFFDEFSKNVKYDMQDAMLSMFSEMDNTRKIYIITENEKNTINRYIRNRPGRIRYHQEFERIEKEVLIGVATERGVSNKFLKDLVGLYDRSREFSFDHLDAIVSEHLNYPNETIDEIVSVLNLGILTKERKYSLISVKEISSGKELMFQPHTMTRQDVIAEYSIQYNIAVREKNSGNENIRPASSSIRFSNKDIQKIDDENNTLSIKLKLYELMYKILTPEEENVPNENQIDIDANISQRPMIANWSQDGY